MRGLCLRNSFDQRLVMRAPCQISLLNHVEEKTCPRNYSAIPEKMEKEKIPKKYL